MLDTGEWTADHGMCNHYQRWQRCISASMTVVTPASGSSLVIREQKCPANAMRAILVLSPRTARQIAYSNFDEEKIERARNAAISIATITGSVAPQFSPAMSRLEPASI
jgi:hypothetical protein